MKAKAKRSVASKPSAASKVSATGRGTATGADLGKQLEVKTGKLRMEPVNDPSTDQKVEKVGGIDRFRQIRTGQTRASQNTRPALG